MDLTRPIAYRGFDLNTTVIDSANPITGCQVNRVRYFPIEGYGYREKRSLSDGLDASDVFLGGRTVGLEGLLYAANRAEMLDLKSTLSAILSPTSAFAEGPGDLGYLPLTFQDATNDLTNYPDGFIDKMMRMRPLATPAFLIDRDHIGGNADLGMAMDWQVTLEARDPRIYAQTATSKYFNANGNTSSGSGTVTNKGEYPAPLKMEIVVSTDVIRVVELTAFGSVIRITVPASSNERIARYDGVEKVLTLEEQGVELTRMDLLEFPSGLTHPLVPAGESSYSWTSKNGAGTLVNVNAASRFFFWEAWT